MLSGERAVAADGRRRCRAGDKGFEGAHGFGVAAFAGLHEAGAVCERTPAARGAFTGGLRAPAGRGVGVPPWPIRQSLQA